jgi:hypothetical protein
MNVERYDFPEFFDLVKLNKTDVKLVIFNWRDLLEHDHDILAGDKINFVGSIKFEKINDNENSATILGFSESVKVDEIERILIYPRINLFVCQPEDCFFLQLDEQLWFGIFSEMEIDADVIERNAKYSQFCKWFAVTSGDVGDREFIVVRHPRSQPR